MGRAEGKAGVEGMEASRAGPVASFEPAGAAHDQACTLTLRSVKSSVAVAVAEAADDAHSAKLASNRCD